MIKPKRKKKTDNELLTNKLIELTSFIEKEINRLGIDSLLRTEDYILAEKCLHTLVDYSKQVDLTK